MAWGRLTILLLALCMPFTSAQALPAGLDALSLRPVPDDGPYLSVWGTRNLRPFRFVAGSYIHYNYRPLSLTRSGTRLRGIVDHPVVQEWYGAMGLVDRWLSVGLTVPTAWTLDYRDPTVASPTTQRKTVIGDIRLHFKTELLQHATHGVGLALTPFVTIPTGAGDYFLGSKWPTGGGILAVEVHPHPRWTLAANVGLEAMSDFTLRNLNKSLQLLGGIASSVQTTPSLTTFAEIVATTRASGPFTERIESPVEGRSGVRLALGTTGWSANLGGGVGILRGVGVGTFRLGGGVTYHHARKKRFDRQRAVAFADQFVIYFDVNATTLSPHARTTLDRLLLVVAKGELRLIELLGHADAPGAAAYNLDLSRRRARAVKSYLATNARAQALTINTMGYGEFAPARQCVQHQRCLVVTVKE
jgi:hypothetical protein